MVETAVPVAEKKNALKKLGTVNVSASPNFLVDQASMTGCGIDYTTGEFEQGFLGHIEKGVPAKILAVHSLQSSSTVRSILEHLEGHAQISITHFMALLREVYNRQDHRDLFLVTNGSSPNIAFCRGKDDRLYIVRACLTPYWCVCAYSVQEAETVMDGNIVSENF